MLTHIETKHKVSDIFEFASDALPLHIKNHLKKFVYDNKIAFVDEIRIHSDACIVLIVKQNNLKTDIYTSEELMEEIFQSLCHGSVYAHIETIKDGFISIGKGIRAGICGKAIVENGEFLGVSNISSISIRLPRFVQHAGDFIYKILMENNFSKSFLLYSAPGVGKTTILRDLVLRLSNTQPLVRHAIIDSKEEITPFLSKSLNANIYLSYPKGLAIELATKCMTPQMIICDEISSYEEAFAIARSINCGVSLVATTHASSITELKTKEILSPLFNCRAFEFAIGVTRDQHNKFLYKMDKL